MESSTENNEASDTTCLKDSERLGKVRNVFKIFVVGSSCESEK